MKRIIQFRISEGENHCVAECLDLPIVTQGKTLDELKSNLEEAIALHLEDENLSEFDIGPHPSVLASFELNPLTHAKT
jgi:predicted RNase H-like HicB family nuclease